MVHPNNHVTHSAHLFRIFDHVSHVTGIAGNQVSFGVGRHFHFHHQHLRYGPARQLAVVWNIFKKKTTLVQTGYYGPALIDYTVKVLKKLPKTCLRPQWTV